MLRVTFRPNMKCVFLFALSAETSGQLITELVKIVREVGREPATPEETRQLLGLRAEA